MTKAQEKAVPQTPTDSAVPAAEETKKAVPSRGTRKRVLGQGEGDFCIYEIAPPNHPAIPAGSLLQIPMVPRFTCTTDAIKWIRNESGDLLAGKQVMVMKACEILHLQVQQRPVVVMTSKAKITVTKPEPEPEKGNDE